METIERQARIEALTEDILTDKQLSAEYDRKFHENTSALTEIQKQMRTIKPTSRLATTAVNMGDFFVQVPTAKAHRMVKSAQDELESAIKDVQQRLEKKVDLLEQLKSSR
ncbi:hypothetical protein LPJ53_006614 [Coemansia erecta]|uniref:Prefoldin n=1 Tax=Coemansia erecta TaxID=147472 RepID=A0A9W7XTG3_9FUNG|nr:hypothetical protein LPJ53_006614 [Coemansia erecta]